jgi:hypothetical protein
MERRRASRSKSFPIQSNTEFLTIVTIAVFGLAVCLLAMEFSQFRELELMVAVLSSF